MQAEDMTIDLIARNDEAATLALVALATRRVVLTVSVNAIKRDIEQPRVADVVVIDSRMSHIRNMLSAADLFGGTDSKHCVLLTWAASKNDLDSIEAKYNAADSSYKYTAIAMFSRGEMVPDGRHLFDSSELDYLRNIFSSAKTAQLAVEADEKLALAAIARLVGKQRGLESAHLISKVMEGTVPHHSDEVEIGASNNRMIRGVPNLGRLIEAPSGLNTFEDVNAAARVNETEDECLCSPYLLTGASGEMALVIGCRATTYADFMSAGAKLGWDGVDEQMTISRISRESAEIHHRAGGKVYLIKE